MANIKARHSNADALDDAIATTLAAALTSADAGPQSNAARVRRHWQAIIALRARHWTWEQIAAKLSEAGLAVSAPTVRRETNALAASRKRRKSAQNTTEMSAPRSGGKAAGASVARRSQERRASTQRPNSNEADLSTRPSSSTESCFFTIDEKDN